MSNLPTVFVVKSIPGSNFRPGFLITDLNGAFEGCLGSGESSAPDYSHAKELHLAGFSFITLRWFGRRRRLQTDGYISEGQGGA